jgi:hypothetical protein
LATLRLLVRGCFDALDLARLEECPRCQIYGRFGSLVLPVLAHETRICIGSDIDLFLELADFHLTVINQGAYLTPTDESDTVLARHVYCALTRTT